MCKRDVAYWPFASYAASRDLGRFAGEADIKKLAGLVGSVAFDPKATSPKQGGALERPPKWPIVVLVRAVGFEAWNGHKAQLYHRFR
jgi:hypothetical protein